MTDEKPTFAENARKTVDELRAKRPQINPASDDLYEAVDELVDIVEIDENGNHRFATREEAQSVTAKLIRTLGSMLNISEFAASRETPF